MSDSKVQKGPSWFGGEVDQAIVRENVRLKRELRQAPGIPMLLHCPQCGERHIDEGEFATKPHHTHACQECGHCWRPAIVPTTGVRFLPGFKNEPIPARCCAMLPNGKLCGLVRGHSVECGPGT